MKRTQVPWLTVFVILIVIIFGLTLLQVFFITAVKVAANIIILYFVFLRAYTEITKYNRGSRYLQCALLALIILVFLNHFWTFWERSPLRVLESVTAFSALTLLFAEAALAWNR